MKITNHNVNTHNQLPLSNYQQQWAENKELGEHGDHLPEEEGFLDEFPSLAAYMESIGLDDPYEFLSTTIDPITEKIQSGFWIEDPYLLTRHISVRIFAAHNMQSALRFPFFLFLLGVD